VSDIDSLIRERMAAAAAFDVVADPRRVREAVARRQRRIRRHRRTTALLGVLAAAGVAVGVVRAVDRDPEGDVAVRPTDTPADTSDDAAASCGTPPYFRPAPGWETVQFPQTGVAATAANIPLGPNTRLGDAPWDTVERLEAGDLVLYAMFWPMGKADKPPRDLPLSLDDAQPGGLEGQPDDVYADRLLAQVDGWNIDLLVFYGGTDTAGVPPVHSEPSAEARADAQEQLARLEVPPSCQPNGA
jgi:hypothetical protein